MSALSGPATDLLIREMASSLRRLHQQILPLQYSCPYSVARLARVADQAEYFIAAWPEESWPPLTRQSQELPARAAVLAGLLHVKGLIASVKKAGKQLPAGSWHQAKTLLLLLLTMFI